VTNARKFYGLERPYDFKVAIPFLLSALELSLVLIGVALLAVNNGLGIGTDRFYFFLYIAALLVAAAAFSRVSILSLGLLFWCTIELGFAVSTATLERYGLGHSLLPQDFTRASTDELGLTYHPLLQAVPRKNWRGTRSFHWRNDKPWDAVIDRRRIEDRELQYWHNSLGLRGRDLTKNDLARKLIFAYGGSTTYDETVSQGETWPERLERALGNHYTVVNFGMHAYGTTEHLIQTAFYQGIVGKRPACAIYYVGLNDIKNAHIPNLDSAYADHHLLGQASLLNVRQPQILGAKFSPTLQLIHQRLKLRFDSLPEAPKFNGEPVTGSDARLEGIYAEHISAITALNNTRGVRTVFIGQMLNRDLLNKYSESRLSWLMFTRLKDWWPLQERFNAILKRTAVANGAKYIDPGIEHFKGSTDFADVCHFSAAGSEKFSRLIAEEVDSYCSIAD
jgi:hypothetical protein